MDPTRPTFLNAESPPQIRERLLLYRAHNVKFVEYFADGMFRELDRTDPLDLTLLATTAFPHICRPELQQLMNALRYFLFDLQNSMRELVPHHGPVFTLSNMVFCRQYPDGRCGVVLPVQTYNYKRFRLPEGLRLTLAETPLADEVELQHKFVETGNMYYLDEVINRVICNFRRRVRDMELEAQMQASSASTNKYRYGRTVTNARRTHWSLVN